MFREKKIYAGAMLEIERRHCSHTGRLIRCKGLAGVTSEKQKEINLRYARRKLCRWLNANFKRGDYFITLTLEKILTAEQRRVALAKFMRKLRAACRKVTGQDLKYICVKEDREVRPHYHLVCQAMPITPTELEKIWGMGRVEIGTLDGNPDYGWMARYLSKQGEQDFYKKRWSQSKNLTPPVETKPKILRRKQLASKPVVPKEYFVLSSYRWGDSEGYVGEYIIAIRYDRRQELPADIRAQMEQSKTWGEWMGLAPDATEG